MTFATRKFDDVLPQLRAEEVRSMARMLGMSSKLPKDECIALIRQGLNDPERVKAAVARLEPFEQVVLAMLKQSGGVLDHEALLLGVLMSGVPLRPKLLNGYDPQREFVRTLIHHGIILGSNDRSPTYINHYGSEHVYTDLRLLAAVTPAPPVPLTIKASVKPTTVLERRPASVALALIGLLQTSADLKNGVGLTQKGEIRSSDQRKIQRAMQWEGDAIQVDGLPFHDPTTLFLTALRYSAWAQETGQNTFILSETPSQIAERSYAEHIQGFLQGVLRATNWRELKDLNVIYYLHKFAQARQALLTLLAALPIGGDEFYAVDDLDQILFNRIGAYFSLTYVKDRPYTYSKSTAEISKIEQEWRTTLRANWLKQERLWLEGALTTWVYFLGLVDLGFENHKLVSIRLSQVGREVLHPTHPTLAPIAPEAVVATEGAWIVQPNFEILAYLDHVTLLAKLREGGKMEVDRTWPRNCLPKSDSALDRGPHVPSDAIARAGPSPREQRCSPSKACSDKIAITGKR